jgi:Kef-type K+ transport system membrane component KefB
MSEIEIGLSILTLGVFVGVVHVLGYAFERLRQPRLVGEIIAGILLGPFVLGQLSPAVFTLLFEHPAAGGQNKTSIVLGFVYWLGILLLMFISGSHVRGLLSKANRRETAWIIGIGTPLPFFLVLGLGFASIIPLDSMIGVKNVRVATLLVLASAVAVTSIPVISRIFHGLRILHTRFASLVLGFAVLEDIALWGVLAVATALTKSASLSEQNVIAATSLHLATTLTYMVAGLTVLPGVLKRVRQLRRNLLYKSSPLAYAICVLFAYVAIAAYLEVNLVFAAFLAGFGLAGGIAGDERQHFTEALDAIHRFSFSVFIPVYFGLVGYRLAFGRDFSLLMFLAMLIGSSLVVLLSRGLAARLAGFQKLDILNLAITTNARGGPGIVLASVAFEAGIISAALYTTLVLTAIVTSQAAGMWLRFVLSKGWPLLSSNPEETGLAVRGRGSVSVQTPAV